MRELRGWGAVWAVMSMAVALVGCGDRPRLDLAQPFDTSFEISCMCAWCYVEDFCIDPDDPTRWAPPDVGTATPCRPGWLRSRRATRITGDGSTESFFCASALDNQRFGTGGACPADETEHALAELVDPCVDVPRCARHPEDARYADCTEQAAPGETCPGGTTGFDEKYVSERTLECRHFEEGTTLAQQNTAFAADAEAVCGHFHGTDVVVPADSPRRYCFTSCIDPRDTVPDCSDPAFDPPFVAADGAVLLHIGRHPVTGDLARAEITVEGETADVSVVGTVYLSAPGCVPGLPCHARISFVELEMVGTVVIAGQTVSNVRLLNTQPLPDAITPLSPTMSALRIDAGGSLWGSGDVVGHGRRAVPLTLVHDLEGVFDWPAHSFFLGAVFATTDGGLSLNLMLWGELPTLPPRADAGPDQTVECASPDGTPVTLSAAGSLDADGDIHHYAWTNDRGVQDGAGVTFTPTIPLGAHQHRVFVQDALGLADSDATVTTVVDTTGPSFEDVSFATDCLWPPDHSLHLFRLGEELTGVARDLCDGETHAMRIVEVRSDQPEDDAGDGSTAPDVVFGERAFCLRGERDGRSSRPRHYFVVLEATDDAGNTTRHEVEIRVPHDQRPSDRCLTGGLAPAVADDDPRCTASLARVPGASIMLPPLAGPEAQATCAVGARPQRGAAPWLAAGLALLLLARRRRRRA